MVGARAWSPAPLTTGVRLAVPAARLPVLAEIWRATGHQPIVTTARLFSQEKRA
jgi:hypothetical protein